MTETEFKKYLIDQYKKLNGAEDPTNYTVQELKTAINFQEKLNALTEKEKIKEKEAPKIPEIKGIDGAKENASILKDDILKSIHWIDPPEIDQRTYFDDQALKKDNQVKTVGEDDEVIILRDAQGRMT